MTSYYDILHISPNSTALEIKQSYRKLSLKYHPDKYKGPPDTYIKINAAYEVLNSENGVYKSLTNQLNGLKPLKIKSSKQINKPLASLIAYLDVAKELIFSKEIIQVYRDSLYTSWKNKNSTQFTDSKAYALQISIQIININFHFHFINFINNLNQDYVYYG